MKYRMLLEGMLKEKNKVMKTRTFTVHQIAICFTCGKRWEDYINHKARKSAYQHAKKTGHDVSVETGLVTRYN